MSAEQIERIAQLLESYYQRAPAIVRRSVASHNPKDHAVPQDMWAGPVNSEGWVDWKLLPSTVTDDDIAELEVRFAVAYPPSFRAYLRARFHCFDQVRSARYDQLISLPKMQTRDPLYQVRELLAAYRSLIPAQLIAFAEWGDGWGPMCFDAQRRGGDGECPILWLDHELIPFGQQTIARSKVAPLEKFLYGSFEELLQDVFGHAG